MPKGRSKGRRGGKSRGGPSKDAQEREERAHFLDVLHGLNACGAFELNQAIERRNRVLALAPQHLARMPGGADGQTAKFVRVVDAIRENHELLATIAQSPNYYQRLFQTEPAERSQGEESRWRLQPAESPSSSAEWNHGSHVRAALRHTTKAKAILHSFKREWSADGLEERRQCFAPLLAQLEKHVPADPMAPNQHRVLLPGAGLGRLMVEVSALGYEAQGNEFDYFMLLASNYVLNKTSPKTHIPICPWVHNFSNTMSVDDAVRVVTFPDECPQALLAAHANPEPRMSMCAGEFIGVYGQPEQRGTWSALLACFFIDTAPNIIEYMELIYGLLKPGGVLISIGPLMYHWAQKAGGACAGVVISVRPTEPPSIHPSHLLSVRRFCIPSLINFFPFPFFLFPFSFSLFPFSFFPLPSFLPSLPPSFLPARRPRPRRGPAIQQLGAADTRGGDARLPRHWL